MLCRTFSALQGIQTAVSEPDVLILVQRFHAMILLPTPDHHTPCRGNCQTNSQAPTHSKVQLALNNKPRFSRSRRFPGSSRVSVPWDLCLDGEHPVILILSAWYHMIGFVAVDDKIFALGQDLLLWLTLRQKRRSWAAERQALLS
jgi:hypothetical protein